MTRRPGGRSFLHSSGYLDVRPSTQLSPEQTARVRQLMAEKRAEARAWTRSDGEDAPEVADCVWPA